MISIVRHVTYYENIKLTSMLDVYDGKNLILTFSNDDGSDASAIESFLGIIMKDKDMRKFIEIDEIGFKRKR